MASIHQEILVDASPAPVRQAVADVGAVHTRLAPDFVVDTQLEPGARVVTFANGIVARELIVAIDDELRRLAWAIVGGRLTHHNASLQVFAEDAGRSRVLWIAGLLPDELAPDIDAMITQGLRVMKKTLERSAA